MGCDASYICTFLSVFLWDLIYLSPILVFLLVLVCMLGVSIGRIEGWSTEVSLYHAFINATTVGYGDIKPEKPASRALAVINAFVGLIFAGIVVGIGVHAVEAAMVAEF
ncbi:potassium channel family protein [Ruegeria sp.]|uniref:potassium channel family protein n=1 Tax=Ruegeria sp. TaxID=1879320 RepID=UPI003B00795F